MDMMDYERYRISDDELDQFMHSTRAIESPLVGKLIQHLVAERMAFDECFGEAEAYKKNAVTSEKEVERLRAIMERSSHQRYHGDHYGPYGTACARTGQLDAGFCWKCQIKALKEKLDEQTGE